MVIRRRLAPIWTIPLSVEMLVFLTRFMRDYVTTRKPGRPATHLEIATIYQGRQLCFSKVADMVNRPVQEEAFGKLGNLAGQQTGVDAVILPDARYQPLPKSGGTFAFSKGSQSSACTHLIITTHLSCSECIGVFGNGQMITALLGRIAHHGRDIDAGINCDRFRRRKRPSSRSRVWTLSDTPERLRYSEVRHEEPSLSIRAPKG